MQLATAGQNNSPINMGGFNDPSRWLALGGQIPSGVNIGAGGDVAFYYLVSTLSGSIFK